VLLGKTYCPQCLLAILDQDTADKTASDIETSSSPAKSKAAAILLIILGALTYLPLLITWDGSSAYFVALLVLAVVSFGFQLSLVIRNTWLAWWGCTISWIVNIVIVAVLFLHSIDPSGILPVIAIIFFGIPALMLLLRGKVSDTAAFVLPLIIIIITTFFLFMYVVQKPPCH
jgi:hypothetical protein